MCVFMCLCMHVYVFMCVCVYVCVCVLYPHPYIAGGSLGVLCSGILSDSLVTTLGLHSRLWILALCTVSPLKVKIDLQKETKQLV